MSYRPRQAPLTSNMASRLPAGAQQSRIGRPKSIRISTGAARGNAPRQPQQQASRVPRTSNASTGVRTSIRMVRPRMSEGTGVLEHRVSPEKKGDNGQPKYNGPTTSRPYGSRLSSGGQGRLSTGPSGISTGVGRVSTAGVSRSTVTGRRSTGVPQRVPNVKTTGTPTLVRRVSQGVGQVSPTEPKTPMQPRRCSVRTTSAGRPDSLRYPTKRENRVTPAGARTTEVRRAAVVDSPGYGNGARRVAHRYQENPDNRRISGGVGRTPDTTQVRKTPGLPRSPTYTGATPPVRPRARFGAGRVRGSPNVNASHRGSVLPDRGADESGISPNHAISLSSGRQSTGTRLTGSRLPPSGANDGQESTYGNRTPGRRVGRPSLGTPQSQKKESRHGSSWKERIANASDILRRARRSSFIDTPSAEEQPTDLTIRRKRRSSVVVGEPTLVTTSGFTGPASRNDSPSSATHTNSIDPEKLTPPTVRTSIANPDRQEYETPVPRRESYATRLSTSARRSSRFGDGKVSLKNIDRLSMTIGRRRSRGPSMTKEDLLNTPTPVMRTTRSTKLLDLTPSPAHSTSSSEPEVLSAKKSTPAGLSSTKVAANISTCDKVSAQGKENSGRGIISDDLSWIDQDGATKNLLTSPDGKKDHIDDLDEDLRWTAMKDHNSPLFTR
eukprot:Plantae.Rhodophyta-Hildenbrandia_rubra.ctg14572.p1 GENE.Plantae.Rhodophyta-Hildenbrandia_rubra.ctg14572~~Plantae.Rhodophyta-Hildenbrandia_rubra.ctg14572.p1  ORF type:complete len:667 (-),score=67.78 Plantae.Rhodophyta-Hildenbrandia_rubra.ctg14572:1146-3146(-)